MTKDINLENLRKEARAESMQAYPVRAFIDPDRPERPYDVNHDARRACYDTALKYKLREHKAAQERERLVKYVQHTFNCMAENSKQPRSGVPYVCTCGLSDALASLSSNTNTEDHGN